MRRYFIWGFLIVSANLSAQFTRFKRVNADDGLTNNTVYCITQDVQGFIWIGTENGINKFDGYSVTRYPFNPEDSLGISAGQIRALLADKQNKLWIGTFRGGLSCLDLITNKFTNYLPDSSSKNCIASEVVNSIVEMDDSTLALGTTNGLNLFNRKTQTFRLISHSEKNNNSLLDDYIRGVVKDKDGSLWIGHPGAGITHYIPNQQKFIRYTVGKDNKHLTNNNVRSILIDKDGLLWISNWNTGLNILDTKTGIITSGLYDKTGLVNYTDGVSLVFNFFEDKSGNIWFATAETGIVKLDKKTGKKIYFKNNPDDADSFGDNTSFAVFEDKTGLIWGGTWRDGVNYFNTLSLSFGHYKHEKNVANTLLSNEVYRFQEIENNEVLIGTSACVNIFNALTHTFEAFYINEKQGESLLKNSQVTSMLKDFDNTFWFSTGGGGLYHYFPKTKKYKNYNYNSDPNSLSTQVPGDLILDNSGNLWVSTSHDGIELFDRKKDNFKHFIHSSSDANSVATNSFYCMVKDKKGMLWLGSYDHGLIQLNPDKQEFSFFYNSTSKNGKGLGISNINIDNDGNFWLVSSEGLLKLNPETREVINLSKENLAFKKEINGTISDDLGNVWMTSSNELIRYNIKTKELTSFYVKDGLQGKEYYGGSLLKLKNGNILMGGNNGFNFFNPKNIIVDKQTPGLVLTNFQVQNKPFPLDKEISFVNEITLSYRDYFFSVDFAATDYANSLKNNFKYKLVGFNDDWVDIGNKHSITFTNLDAGDYVLNIKAANNNGYWNETPFELKITITPPFWRTNWFYALCIILTVFSIYSFIKYREKKLIKEKNILENKVNERTEELNQEKLKVEEAHKDIKDSILYAKRIQTAILTPPETLKNAIKESFILYQPKDVVSGDFYWILHVNEKKIGKNIVVFAAADCTGHGVPGAFMSMLNSTLLNQTAYNSLVNTPADALNFLNEELPKNLKSSDKTQTIKDGMDIAFCLIDLNSNQLKFAGANNPCWVIRNKQLIELDPTKQAITASEEYPKKTFIDQEFKLEKGDCVYLFTDGYADQFGGPKGKKFKYKTLANLLIEINDLPMEEQHNQLAKSFADWKGDLEQVDDVCVIGVRI